MNDSELKILPYDLPDVRLLTTHDLRETICVYIPACVMVVIGRGTRPELELNEEAIRHDSVPVLQRPSGGCSVVLSPEMLVAAMLFLGTEQKKTSEIFRFCNSVIIESLELFGVNGLAHSGISDLTLNGRKIAGAAIYRNRERVFYHAILNVSADTSLMERYLKFPPRTPVYRDGRSHREFVTSINAEIGAVDSLKLSLAIERVFLSRESQF